MDGLLLLLWHKEQRAAGAGAAGYGVAAATPLTLRNSIIPGEERKPIRSTSKRNCVRNGSRFSEKINPIKNSTDRSAKKASTNTGTAGLRNPNRWSVQKIKKNGEFFNKKILTPKSGRL